MSLTMYRAAAPLILQTLKGLDVELAKTEAYCEHRKLDQAVVLQTRIWPDMFPLWRQIEQTATHSMRGMASLAGDATPVIEGEDTNLAQSRTRVQAAIDYVSGILPEALDGSEAREISLNSPRGVFNFTGEQFLFNVSLPNILFHATTAYNLLRGLGVEIGKMDFVGRTTA